MFEDDDIMLDYYEGKKAHRRFNNLAPLLEEKGLDPQLALDANYVPSRQPKEYDDQFLQNDKNFQAVGRVMYNMDVNANNKKLGTRGVEKNIPQTDLDYANYALDQLGWFNYNIPQMIYDGVSLSKATPDQRIAFYYGMKAYDRLKNFTRSGTARFFKGVVADPSTYLGLGTIGLAVRSLTKKGLTKAGWMNTLKLAGVGATEGAAYAAIDDYFRQDVAIGAEAQESFDLQKYLKFNIENPALVGAAAGGIPTAAPAVATKLGKEAIDLAKRVEIDDSATLGSTNIPLKLKPEDSKKKTLNNNNLSFLNEKYSDVDISISEKDKGITLSELVVPEGKRNQGIGTQVMQDIINYADSNNKTIALTPDTTFGASKTRLKEFYKNLGFVENKGKNKDFRFTETLIRKPLSVDDFNINPNKIKAPTENETGILAFHGSAADFDEFRLDKIGTGEGNQAFGYGLYFSDSEDIAKFYTSALRKREPVLFKGEPIKYISDTAEGDLVSNDIINLNRVRDRIADKGMSLQEAKDSAIDELQQTISNFQKNDENKKVINELNKDINFINNLQDKDFSYNTGKTYKVDIKAFRDNLLDHDKPVSKQNKIIKDIIQKIYLENDLKPLRKTTTGEDVIDELAVKFSKLENNKLIYDNKKVSEILNAAGIKGIKYKSGQLSGMDDSLATNFVIFDDKIIKVLAKYGIVAPVAISAIKGNKEQQTQDNSI